LAVGLWVHP